MIKVFHWTKIKSVKNEKSKQREIVGDTEKDTYQYLIIFIHNISYNEYIAIDHAGY